MKSTESKFRTVIEKNTFYFSDRVFEEGYEGHLSSVRETLLVLKKQYRKQFFAERAYRGAAPKRKWLNRTAGSDRFFQ